MEKAVFNPFLLKKLYNSNGIPVLVFKENEEKKYIPADYEGIIFEYDEGFMKEMMGVVKNKDRPVIVMEQIRIFYGAFKDKEGRFFIWGPATLEQLNKQQLTAYKHKHNITQEQFTVRKSTYEVLSNLMSIAFFYYTGKSVDEEDILVDWQDEGYEANLADIERYQLDKSEMNRIHDSVEFENKYMAAVEQGDVSAMKKLMQVNSMDVEGIGVLAENATKQMEYLCVSSILLVSRAAIRGGMNPEAAYDLSDVYFQKLEKCKTVEDMAFVSSKMQLDFTERVRQAQSRRRGNIYVEKCKDYVANHLRKPFQVHEIASALQMNRSYLSRIFKEQEGVTIQEYVTHERCAHAANMLKYTDYSISIIAEYFCFSTQSHFGKQFRSIYGITPNEYRRENRYINSFYDKSK